MSDPADRLIYRPDGALDRGDFVEARLERGHRLTKYLLQVLSGTGGVIAGGYARWCASPRTEAAPFEDVDVFCRDEVTLARVRCALAHFGHQLIRENTVSFVYAGMRRWFSANVPPINVVKPVVDGRVQTCGDLHEILHNFDFTISKVGILGAGRALAHFAFHDDEKALRLRFTRIHTPVTGVVRALKYAKRGYRISLREIMRVFHYWDEQRLGYRRALKSIVHVRPHAGMAATQLSDGTVESYDVDEDVLGLADVYRLMLIGPPRRRGRPSQLLG